MANKMAATTVTLTLNGHSPVPGLFKCNLQNIYAAFLDDFTVLTVPLR